MKTIRVILFVLLVIFVAGCRPSAESGDYSKKWFYSNGEVINAKHCEPVYQGRVQCTFSDNTIRDYWGGIYLERKPVK